MERKDDILSEAIEQFRNEPVPAHPPRAVVDATLRELTQINTTYHPHTSLIAKVTTRLVAAAAILVLAGYAIGRLTAPPGPDIEQLERNLISSVAASIEPIVRQSVMQDVQQQWHAALTASHMQLKDDLTQQYQADLNRYAIQTLMASNEVTNRLLGELAQGINTAQTQKMQWVAGVLEQIERKRINDKTQLAAGIKALAYRTEDGLQQTREDLVHLLATTYLSPAPSNVEELETRERID